MDLIKCPICGEEYSPSYKSCPFCEEDDERPVRKRPAKRHITTRKKAQSARGGMIVVLVLVLALFGWYLFGDKLPRGEKAPKDPAVETANPAQTANDPASAENTENPDGTEPSENTEPAESSDPPVSAVHVDASSLGIKTNVSGVLPKDPMTGFYDCSLKKKDSIRLIVTGTDVPVSGWTSENTGIVSVDDEGRLTLAGTGTTHVTATVGDASVTCIVRVR